MIRMLSIAALLLSLSTGTRAVFLVQYTFDGNALDSSGYGNHGSIIGGVAFVPGCQGMPSTSIIHLAGSPPRNT